MLLTGRVMCLVCSWSSDRSTKLGLDKTCSSISTQGRALATHGGPWRQTFAPGRPGNHIQGTLDFTGRAENNGQQVAGHDDRLNIF